MFSCSNDGKVRAFSIPDKKKKFEFSHESEVNDIFIGREGTPLQKRLISICMEGCFRVSNLESGLEVQKIDVGPTCLSVAVDWSGTIIAIGTGPSHLEALESLCIFFETENFTKVKEFKFTGKVTALAFNDNNDCMLATTSNGEIHSFKFTSMI